jgi:hypothetical protein
MAGLAGLGVGEAVGGVTGALLGMGIPEFEAKRYEGRLQKGEILLSVHCDTAEEIKRAKEVLKSAGGRGRFLHGRVFCRCQEDRPRLGRYDCALNSLVQEEEVGSRLPLLQSWETGSGNQNCIALTNERVSGSMWPEIAAL